MTSSAQAIAELTSGLAERLTSRKQTLATAESCTGGMIATYCTDLAGSSVWFNGGIVSYSNAMKIKLLGVDDTVLEQQGAVSAGVAEQMAWGAIRACG
ncbi:MAG: CinA family protein, partial [Idiomarina sp.]|nr:CinA family protein [Idiomarina sp.]